MHSEVVTASCVHAASRDHTIEDEQSSCAIAKREGERAKTRPTLAVLLRRSELFQHLIGNLEVGEDVLHIVVVL
jgi:hypothetical protein